MDATRAPNYDLFKLIVAILLLILALVLLWMSPPQAPVPTVTPLAQTPSATLSASPTTVPASGTSPPLTMTAAPVSSPTATIAAMPTSTSLPSPTPTSIIELSTTPIAGNPPMTNACDLAASRSRLQIGTSVTILRRLNFRSSPGIHNNWILTNTPGTTVEIVAGPECVPHSIGAYVWWQIKLPDGRVGWSAEGSLLGSFYFMEPIQ